MSERTPEQQASATWARAVFSDPDLRAKFELMAKETASREPVRDDFAWLDPKAGEVTDEYSRFESLARRLIGGSKPSGRGSGSGT
jgi:hypothetical protein